MSALGLSAHRADSHQVGIVLIVAVTRGHGAHNFFKRDESVSIAIQLAEGHVRPLRPQRVSLQLHVCCSSEKPNASRHGHHTRKPRKPTRMQLRN